jgi:hypothetical protein
VVPLINNSLAGGFGLLTVADFVDEIKSTRELE